MKIYTLSVFVMFYSFLLMIGCVFATHTSEAKTVGEAFLPYVVAVFFISFLVKIICEIRKTIGL